MLHEYQIGQLDKTGATFACSCGVVVMAPTLDEADTKLDTHIAEATDTEMN